jgi:hypothetical protein
MQPQQGQHEQHEQHELQKPQKHGGQHSLLFLHPSSATALDETVDDPCRPLCDVLRGPENCLALLP